MQYRALGRRGPTVSVLGFGAMTLAPGIYADVDEREAAGTLQAALDAGITLIDTADIYGAGHSESLIGRVLRGRREEFVLATKFGGDQDEQGRLVPGMGRPEYVRSALDASLARLGTDRVDLYYLHRLDPDTPVEETMGALAELVQAGKIGHIGLSEVSARTIRRACAVHPVTAVQSEYSLFNRAPEKEVLPVCEELGVGFVAYSPLGRGLLGGAIRARGELGPGDWRRGNPRFQEGNLDRNVALADSVAALAGEHGLSVAQLALAWLMHQGTVPIPGTRRVANVRANAAAADVTLDKEVLLRLEELVPPGAAAGAQGDDAYLGNIDR
ncbi:aldo/keto reductase [Nonomuraea zeae]|uniref:Aldo/keto reductase n=1 Tax=Nonomuraea zeae TaxID=1642303 RepID=A0A5S4FDP1_9ACTN|nr:aldo/keto reductase [Nonomuraea zeae]TMR16520.1 aldo/keto reductase [Nonomuraea zeae]